MPGNNARSLLGAALAAMCVCTATAFAPLSRMPARVAPGLAAWPATGRLRSGHDAASFRSATARIRTLGERRGVDEGQRRSSSNMGGLRMGGYEVSSAKSMGTEYTFLAAKCFVNGAVQPAEVKVEDEMITGVKVMSEAEYAVALASAPKFVLPIGPGNCL